MKLKKRNENITTLEEFIENNTNLTIDEFMNPPKNPFIKNLSELAAALETDIRNGEAIHIVGDYDCDGICSSAILYLLLTRFGAKADVRMPRRFSEGYGLSEKIIDEFEDGVVLTVDNGIASHAAIEKAKARGFKVYIIDHHLKTPEGYPDADIIVDPNALPGSEFNGYCGAGLALRLAETMAPHELMLNKKLCVLASVATVADVVPLVNDNRRIVIDGLKYINRGVMTTGMTMLTNKIDCDYFTEASYGFTLGPIMNAAGRLIDDGGVKVLSVIAQDRDHYEAGYMQWLDSMADALIETNKIRKSRAKEEEQLAVGLIEKNGFKNIIVIEDDYFSEGIVGITAGKLCEKYGVPAIVLTKHEGVYKGSGRSTPQVHLKELLDQSGEYLTGYGGHAGAAGLSLNPADLEAFKESIERNCPEPKVNDTVYYDFEISVEDIENWNNMLDKYAPYGEGHQSPVFLIRDFKLAEQEPEPIRLMGAGSEHIKLIGEKADAIGFGLGFRAKTINTKDMALVGALSVNVFNGRCRNQIELIEIQ